MLLIISATLLVVLLTIVFVIRSSFVPPKGGSVRLMWKDHHSLPSLLSRIPLILVGAIFKKEGRFYPGLKNFPETHIEVGASEYVLKRAFFETGLFPSHVANLCEANLNSVLCFLH
jgi:hypothetical protein